MAAGISITINLQDGGASSTLASLANAARQLATSFDQAAQSESKLSSASGTGAQSSQALRTAVSGLSSAHTATTTATTAHTSALGGLKSAASSAASGGMSVLGTAMNGLKDVVGTVGSGVQSLVGHFTNSGTAAQGASSGVSALGSGLSGLAQYVGVGAVLAGGLALVKGAFDALGGAKDTLIGVNSELEQSQLKFQVYLGSADQAKAFIAALNTEAEHSTFGLQQIQNGAAQLLAYHVNAQQVIPILQAVENAAASTGTDMVQNFSTINRVIGELAGGLPLTERQLRQLIQAGLPLQPLADQLHVTVAQLLDVGKTGIVTSAQFVAAFQQVYTHGALGDFMTQQAQTWAGAWQLIKTDVQIAGATAFTPFFNLLRDGVVQVSKFIQGNQFQQWGSDVAAAMTVAANAIRSFVSGAGTIVDTIKNALASGDVPSMFQLIANAAGTAMTAVKNNLSQGAQDFLTAGYNLIVTYASGMKQAAEGVLSSVVNEIANFIGSFFIGQSPPPTGPLAQIRTGGQKVMEAYSQGMQDGTKSVSDVAQSVLDTLQQVNVAASLPDGVQGLQDAGYAMKDLKASGDDVNDVLTTIGDAITGVDDQINTLNIDIQQTKQPYQDQLDILNAQLDTIKQQTDWTDKKNSLLEKQQELTLKQQEANDPTLKNLNAQLDQLQQQRDKLSFIPPNAADQLKLNQISNELRNLPSGKTSAAQRLSLENQAAAIRQRDQAATTDRTTQRDQLDQQIQDLKDQITAADSQYKGKLSANALQQSNTSLSQQQFDVNQQLAELPLDQNIAKTKSAMDAATKPLDDQLTKYKNIRSELDLQKTKWDNVKSAIGDVNKTLTDQAAALKPPAAAKLPAASKTAKGASPDLSGGIPGIPKLDFTANLPKPADLQAKGEEMAQSLLAGVKGYLEKNWVAILGGALGGLVGGPFGALIGSGIGKWLQDTAGTFGTLAHAITDFWGIVTGKIPTNSDLMGWILNNTGPFERLAGTLGLAFRAIGTEIGRLFDTFQHEGFGAAFSKLLADIGNFVGKLLTAVEQAAPGIAARLLSWGRALEGWIQPHIGPAVTELGKLAVGILIWITAQVPKIQAALLHWADEFVHWIGPRLPDILAAIGMVVLALGEMIGKEAAQLGVQLAKWGDEFVKWVAPKIPPMIRELGTLLQRGLDWIFAHLPDLTNALIKWGDEFVKWVAPKIPPMILELGKLIAAVLVWIAEQLPGLTENLAKWGLEFSAWVATTAIKLIAELAKLSGQMFVWIVEQIPTLVENLAKWGLEFAVWAPVAAAKMLGELLKLGLQFDGWVLGEIPTLVENLAKWGLEFAVWVPTALAKMLVELVKLDGQFIAWQIAEIPKIAEQLGKWGVEFVKWAANVLNPENLPGELEKIWQKISGWIIDTAPKIETAMLAFILKFTKPFQDIGKAIDSFFGGLKNAINSVGKDLGVGDIFKSSTPSIAAQVSVPTTSAGSSGSSGGGTSGAGGATVRGRPVADPLAAMKLATGQHDGVVLDDAGRDLGRGDFPNLSDLVKGVGTVSGDVWNTISGAIKDGGGALLDAALKTFGVTLDLPGDFAAIGKGLASTVIGDAKDALAGLLGKLKDSVGGDNNVVQIAMGMLSGDGAAWDGWCQRFVDNVRQAAGFGRSGYGTAADHEAALAASGQLRAGIGPPGTAQLWGTQIGADGHIDVNGPTPGMAISTGSWGIAVVPQSIFGASSGWAPIQMAQGGIITEHVVGRGLRSGRTYHLGEGGQAEAVVPLGRGAANLGPAPTVDPATLAMFDLANKKTKTLATGFSDSMQTMIDAAKAKNAELAGNQSSTQQRMLDAARAKNAELAGNQSSTQQTMLDAARAKNAELAGNQSTTMQTMVDAARAKNAELAGNQSTTQQTMLDAARAKNAELAGNQTTTAAAVLATTTATNTGVLANTQSFGQAFTGTTDTTFGDALTSVQNFGKQLLTLVNTDMGVLVSIVQEKLNLLLTSTAKLPPAGATPAPATSTSTTFLRRLGTASVPQLAAGGVTQSEGLYHLHPHEAVIPLDKAAAHGVGAGGDTYVTLQVAGSVVSEQELVRNVYAGLQKLKRQNGVLGLT